MYDIYLPPEYSFVRDIMKLMQTRLVIIVIAERFWQSRAPNGNTTAMTRVHVRATINQVDVNWKSSMLTEFAPH